MLSLAARALALLILVCVQFAGIVTCSSGPVKVRVLCAGSLIVPFSELEKAYEAKHPGIDIETEGHGSIQVIRHVTELGDDADIVAVADYSLIAPMMYDTMVPDTETPYAEWYLTFATNTLGLACTPGSRYANEITAENWYEILSRPEVKLGIPDARFDACGYRAFMVCQLAEWHYERHTIFEDVLGGFTYPVTVSDTPAGTLITIPEILKPEKISIRGSSVVLLGILESGDIDYAFEYRSVAQQHGLEFIEFPPEINLGSTAFESLDHSLKVRLDYQRFKSVIPEFVCQPIVYGITIPNSAPNRAEAIDFLYFMFSEEGKAIFSEYSQPLVPLAPGNPDTLPGDIRLLVVNG